MFKRIAKFGKWFVILYVAQALFGIALGLYLFWSGSSVFGIKMFP
jgi:hypothetical protein